MATERLSDLATERLSDLATERLRGETKQAKTVSLRAPGEVAGAAISCEAVKRLGDGARERQETRTGRKGKPKTQRDYPGQFSTAGGNAVVSRGRR